MDDGFSGANFDRPGFKRMIADAEAGLIGTVICKDMSRFGRDYLKVGLYTEIRFPEMGIRFIAVSDGVDSEDDSGNDFTPFRNIINEWYCRDVSKKIKASMRARAQAGQHLTGFAPYGYIKSKENKNKWLVDEEAATIVKEIFQRFIGGQSASEIAQEMNRRGLLPPREYSETKHNRPAYGKYLNMEKPPVVWRLNAVLTIIDRYEYCGHTVSCKSVSASYKSKKHIRIPKDEWLIFNPENGEFMDNPGGQGYESGSSWSRGQSWALYGFVLSYILSGKAEYLDAAKRVANYFISQCCDDWLPRCDFRQPEEERILDNAAGNIAACGLIELARQLPEREGKRYFDAALCILKAQEADAANWAEDDPAIFTKCTVAYHSPEGRHITMTYADYFFIEAVNKLRGEELLFWNP